LTYGNLLVKQSARQRDRPVRDRAVMFKRYLSGLSGKRNANRLIGRNKPE
jgi:hypothetical protein